MSLDAPAWLAVLLVLPALVYLRAVAARRRRAHAVRFPGVAVLAGLATAEPRWRKHLPVALLLAALAALCVALARPQHSVAVADERASIVLVMDASRSMDAVDVSPSRLTAAKRAAQAFLDQVPGRVRTGVVGYSDRPHIILRPTADRDISRAAIDALHPIGGTATGDALLAAIESLPQRGRRLGRRPPSAIVLLSDGQATDGADPVQVAQRAGSLRIPIYTVALGTPDGVVPGGPFGQPLPVPPDPETLRRIAAESGGQAFEVEDDDRLEEIYKALGARLATKREQREITSSFAAAGLVLLLLAAAAGVVRQGRLP